MTKKKIIIIAGAAIVVLGAVGYGLATGKFSANLGYSAKEEISDVSTPEDQKCNDDAKAYFKKSPLSKDPNAKFVSNYSQELKQCFIETAVTGKDMTTKFIFDIGSSRTYGRAYIPTSKTGTFSCMTGNKICLTQQDYDGYRESVMKN